jgi:hypothetical protein
LQQSFKCEGEAAIAEIEAETRHSDVAEAWELDHSSYASVKYFCTRVAKLDGGDAVILEAGLATRIFEISEGDESCITVNVISTVF